jgi:hypothetical protein
MCTIAYWHYPRFSSGAHGNTESVQVYWETLVEAGAEVVLAGHDHDYERFAPQDSQGGADPARGVRQFVVGTGGRSHYPFPGPPIPNSEARDASTFGVLVLRLFESAYEWEFVAAGGGSFSDSGSDVCRP